MPASLLYVDPPEDCHPNEMGAFLTACVFYAALIDAQKPPDRLYPHEIVFDQDLVDCAWEYQRYYKEHGTYPAE